jgi:hypothetical protein
MPTMKIRRRWLLKAAGFTAACAVRLWVGTLRYRYRPLGPNVDPHHPECRDRYIYAFWHENMLLPAYHYGRSDVYVLISQHADGQLIAEVCRHLGFRTVRGSTTRGGVEAVRQMLRAGRKVQPGLVYLAARTGLPIVPAGFAYDRPWRARSWDRFAMPRPWSLGTCVTGDPIAVPPDVDREGLEHYRRLVEDALLRVTAAAERLAERSRAA